jgi:hypothetical protein
MHLCTPVSETPGVRGVRMVGLSLVMLMLASSGYWDNQAASDSGGLR